MDEAHKWMATGGVLIAVAIYAYFYHTVTPAGRRRLAILLLVFAVLLLFGLLVHPVRAHDHSNPDRNDYLKSLHSKGKTWCCDGNDTDAIEDWETKGNHYRVKFRGQWFDVPDDVLIDAPNKIGEPLLWMNKGYSGFSVRCFMPGVMG